jgi:hypothetical protein
MTRHRSALTQARRTLYLTQRAIGDAQAAQKGTLGRRIIRREATRRSPWLGLIARLLSGR